MKDLYDLLETRCCDVFEMKLGDTSHNKQAILARGNLTFYFSKVSVYLNKVFGCGFEIDWNYVPKDAFCEAFSYISKNYMSIKVDKMDGVQYYFRLAKQIWDYLTDFETIADTPFIQVKAALINKMPIDLCNARLFRNGDLTMAGLIYFMAPLLSVNDRYRLIDDVTRIFAKDISFYQGEHCDMLYDSILDVFPKSTMFTEFLPFFKITPKTQLEKLARIMFSDKANLAQIEKEGENTYSYSLDLSDRGIYQPLVLKGTIEENSDSFTINMNPFLCKYDFLFDDQNESVTISKDVLDELVEYSKRTPAFVMPLALAFFFRENQVDSDCIRSLGPSFFFFQCGSYYYDDRERSEYAYKPLYRAGFCVAACTYTFETFNRFAKNSFMKDLMKQGKLNPEKFEKLRTYAQWINLLWKYDMILGGDLIIEGKEPQKVSISTTALAKYLVELLDFVEIFDENISQIDEGDMDAINEYAIRGLISYMDVLVTKKYSNDLFMSKKILDSLSLTERDWQSAIATQQEDAESYLPGKLITDDAMKLLSPRKPMIDTWLCDTYNGMEYSQNRMIKKITRVHITTTSESILIRGKDTLKKELTLVVVDESELNGITGKDGRSLTTKKTTQTYTFLTDKEMVC